MSNLPGFGVYAAAFEESLQDDNWDRLAEYFAPEAVYLPGDGTQAEGRAAVLQALQDSVNALERKCDSRVLEGEPDISEEGDTITLRFTLRYTCSGRPDLRLVGYETAQFSDGLIVRMEDVFEDPAGMIEWRNAL